MRKAALLTVLAGLAATAALGAWWLQTNEPVGWNEGQIAVLRTLWLGSLPDLPPEPSNAVADDPRAARLGREFFFDARMSGNGAVSCATCHQPARRFTDGLMKGRGIGESKRNTRSIIGTAYSPWQYWDGRKDSLWSQALSPLENPDEHGGTRMHLARLVAGSSHYRQAYEALFGTLPDFRNSSHYPDDATPLGNDAQRRSWQSMTPEARRQVNIVFSNIGKAIGAYERLLLPGPSRFDRYVEAVLADNAARQKELYTNDEVAGLRLFIGEARCTECHNGPLLTNNEFHNTGVLAYPGDLPDRGRITGVREVHADPFNCLGPFSDDPAHDCPELRFARDGIVLLGAFRTPSLRNLGGTAPFMHQGQLANLEQVLDHYNRAPLAMIGHDEAKPLALSRRQLRQLQAFLETLDAPPATPAEWLEPPLTDRRLAAK